MIWLTITNLGDSALMVPSILVIYLWLLDAAAWRLSWIWLGLCGAAAALVATTKLAFLGWGLGIDSLDFTGISGHSTLAVGVFTTAAFLLALGRSGGTQALAAAVGCVVGLAIAVSRLALGVHSPSEVVAGITLGLAVALGFILSAWRRRPPRSGRTYYLAIALIIPVALLYGNHAPTEGMLAQLAVKLSGHPCPYSRAHPHDLTCAPAHGAG